MNDFPDNSKDESDPVPPPPGPGREDMSDAAMLDDSDPVAPPSQPGREDGGSDDGSNRPTR